MTLLLTLTDILELLARLSLSPSRLSQTEPESISLMDAAVFLLHTSYSAHCRNEELRTDTALKSPDLTARLCTEDQQTWWASVYGACSAGSPCAVRYVCVSAPLSYCPDIVCDEVISLHFEHADACDADNTLAAPA